MSELRSGDNRQNALNFRREGNGERLLMIHGIGHRYQMWNPIVVELGADYDTVAVDLPGFGDSASLPAGEVPTPSRLADAIEETLDELGWESAHLVGNSLGAWVSLELARRGRALSVCALMPAGVWKEGEQSKLRRIHALFWLWTNGAHIPRASSLVRSSPFRSVALFGLFGKPWKIDPEVAAGDVQNLRACDFDRTMDALDGKRFVGGAEISVPVTVVFGGLDPLVREQESDLKDLPPQTKVVTIQNIGHVPTWDDPERVSTIIRQTAGG